MEWRVLDVAAVAGACFAMGCASQPAAAPQPMRTTEAAPDDPATCVDDWKVVNPSAGNAGPGHLEPETIRGVVRSHYPAFQRCYSLGLSRHPQLQGTTTVQFVIGVDGKITTLRVAYNSLADCAAVRCMRDAMASMEFPPPEGGIVTVQYPLMLEPSEPPPASTNTPPATAPR